MVSASSIAVAMTLAAVASAQALPPAPSYYWAGRATPDFVITPLPTVHFSWGIRWTPDNATAYVVGTFNYSAAHGYVGVGTKSARGMDGLNIICSAVGAVIRCDDWDGAGYDIDLAGKSLTRVLSSRITPDVNQVVFERIAVQNGTDLGHFAWGSTARVIWAFGPGSGEGAGEHPGEGIASNLMDFKTGKKPVVANPGRHLVPAMIAVGVTVLIAIVVQVTTFARIPVHHLARDIFGWAMLVVYIVLFCWYVMASIPDYVDMGVMGAEARAMGDGAAAALAVLLLSGVRRFLPQDVLGVSHERMIAYHTVAGLAFMACTLGHAWAMVEFYFLPYMFRWVAGEKFAKLPGTIAFVLSVFVVLPAIVRFHISYRFFRITHFLWVPVAIMTILHVPRLLWFCLPGLIGLVLNFVYGRVANCGAVIEHVAHDQATMCVTIDISRPYYSFTATGDCPEMGIAPAQWFYLCQLGMSLAWHPFSVARAEVKADASGKRRQHLRFVIKETHGLAGGGGPVMNLLNAVANGAGIRKTVDNARGFGSWTTKVWAAAAAADSEDSARAAFGSMWIEGPFGRVQTPLKTYQNIILVSGGIGVTPNLLILQYIAHMSAAAAARGQPAPWRHVLWTWVNREPGMFAMFAEDLVKYAAMLKTAGVELTLRNFCTGKGPGLSESAGGLGFDVTVGARPQYETEFREFAATCTSGTKAHAAMYSCGPVPMIDAAGDAASTASSSTQLAIHHHSEVFDV